MNNRNSNFNDNTVDDNPSVDKTTKETTGTTGTTESTTGTTGTTSESTQTEQTTETAALQQALEDAKQKIEENWNLYVRSRADIDNIRRRAALDIEAARNEGIKRFARELLSVVDSFEHGIQVAETAHDPAYREGMALTLKLFLDIFEKFGVLRIAPNLGDPFDPNKHEAISIQENPEAKPNSILVLAQPGFTLQEQVLRPARVVVAANNTNTKS